MLTFLFLIFLQCLTEILNLYKQLPSNVVKSAHFDTTSQTFGEPILSINIGKKPFSLPLLINFTLGSVLHTHNSQNPQFLNIFPTRECIEFPFIALINAYQYNVIYFSFTLIPTRYNFIHLKPSVEKMCKALFYYLVFILIKEIRVEHLHLP